MAPINPLTNLFRKIRGNNLGADRKTMEMALQEHCVPVLRSLGFKGSFPNFFRDTNGFVALANVQFFSSGGSFCVNLGYADPQRKTIYCGPEIETKKLRVGHSGEKCRLGAVIGGDKWFSYGETNYGEFRGKPESAKKLALTCGNLLSSEAENWWQIKQSAYLKTSD